jgi:hypothetical protein
MWEIIKETEGILPLAVRIFYLNSWWSADEDFHRFLGTRRFIPFK